jgi:hypothetical protein
MLYIIGAATKTDAGESNKQLPTFGRINESNANKNPKREWKSKLAALKLASVASSSMTRNDDNNGNCVDQHSLLIL